MSDKNQLDETNSDINEDEVKGNVTPIQSKDRNNLGTKAIDDMLTEFDPKFLKDLESLASDVKIESEKVNLDVNTIKPNDMLSTTLLGRLKLFFLKPHLKYSMIGFGLAIILPLTFYLISIWVTGLFALPYKQNLNEFADKIYSFSNDSELVMLYDEFKKPMLNFVLPELTVNLATMPGGLQSYGKISIQIETEDEHKLELLKKKQAELIDISQRVLERLTWQDLSTTQGKIQTKKNLLLTMNKVLGDNLVTEVFYYSFFTKK